MHAASELILHGDRTALRAMRWTDKKTVWEYKGERGSFHGFVGDVAVFATLDHYLGMDVAMGTRIYKVEYDSHYREYGRLAGPDDCWYLMNDGYGREPHRTRLKRFNAATGKTFWDIEIELPDQGPTLLPGIALGNSSTFFFNRATGKSAKKITNDPKTSPCPCLNFRRCISAGRR